MGKKIQSKKKVSAPVPSQVIGFHNQNYASSGPVHTEVVKGNSYRDRSTVCFVPSLGSIPVRVVQSWNALMKGMNQKFSQIFIVNQEVGQAYEQMVDILRGNPELQAWKYVLTLEEDNCPPPDGLLRLYEDIERGNWDAVGGLYWTKGFGGKPMCYGKMEVMPKDFIPWLPPPGSVAQCHGLGMGFTLFKMKMFLDTRFERPLFKTQQDYAPGVGVKAYTQDLRFFENAGKLGYRVACSTNVLVGHYDKNEDKMW